MGTTFWLDIRQSHRYELALASALEQHGFITTIDQSRLKNDWDVLATLPGKYTVGFEVKFDRIAGVRSNYVAVEVQKFVDQRWQPCGIHTTKSTFLAYAFTGDPAFYIIDTQTLVDTHLTSAYERIVEGGDRNQTRLMLVDLDRFKSMCKRLDIPDE